MVAATFPRGMFDCRACADAERRGDDLRLHNSGAARSCEGPRDWPLLGGRLRWCGCPRASLTPRVAALLDRYALAGGRLSWSEQRASPLVLSDAFLAIREAEGLAAQHRAEEEERRSRGPGGWDRR